MNKLRIAMVVGMFAIAGAGLIIFGRRSHTPVKVALTSIPVSLPAAPAPDNDDLRVGEIEPFNFPKAASADGPPSPIKIGPYYYRVEFRRGIDMQRFDLRGITYSDKQLILVSDDLVSGHLRECVLHEVMHACQDIKDRMSVDGNTMDADTFIERTAPTLLEVMKDNPKLVEWFQAPSPDLPKPHPWPPTRPAPSPSGTPHGL